MKFFAFNRIGKIPELLNEGLPGEIIGGGI